MTLDEIIKDCGSDFFYNVAASGCYRERDISDHVSDWLSGYDLGSQLEDTELLRLAEQVYVKGHFPNSSSISDGLGILAYEQASSDISAAIANAAQEECVDEADEVSGGPPDDYLAVGDLFVVIDEDGGHVAWKHVKVFDVQLWITCDDDVDSVALDMAKAVADGREGHVSELAGEEGQDQGPEGLRQGQDAD
jgi:hypothetical protein